MKISKKTSFRHFRHFYPLFVNCSALISQYIHASIYKKQICHVYRDSCSASKSRLSSSTLCNLGLELEPCVLSGIFATNERAPTQRGGTSIGNKLHNLVVDLHCSKRNFLNQLRWREIFVINFSGCIVTGKCWAFNLGCNQP